MKTYLGIGLLAVAVAIGGAVVQTNLQMKSTTSETASVGQSVGFGSGHHVTLYRSPTCGCCLGYAEALRAEGFTVEVIEDRDMRAVKAQYAIPATKESCHTSVIDGSYVVEGHVPLEAVKTLLQDRPDIAGIGLPSMPSGTPGMPGPKFGSYKVYQLTRDGDVSPYLTI